MAFRDRRDNAGLPTPLNSSMNLLLLALVPACFALNPITARVLADVLGPASLALVRWSLSGLVIAAIALALGRGERWRAPPRQLLRIGVLGALGMGFCAYAAYMAARTTEATSISLIYGSGSALVAAWEMAAGRQRAGWRLLLGISSCLAGVALIFSKGHPDALLNLTFTAGDLWAAAGMLGFAGYTIAMRRVPATLTTMPQYVVMSVATTLTLLPFAITEVAAAGGLPALDGRALAWLAVVVLATGIGAFLGYNISLLRNGPVLTSASLTLTSSFTAVQAMLLIGEQLRWYHGVAILLVVAGLLLINRDQARR
jgi:drug/metabolite transporter (DMT)-like permease